MADIRHDANRKRRRVRAITLLGVLARGWAARHYAPHAHVSAVYGDHGYWVDPHDVTATWLARASSTAWLPNGSQVLSAPSELCLRTPQNRAAYGADRSVYLAKVDDSILRSPILEALGVRMGPGIQDLISRLRALTDQPVTDDIAAEVRTIYSLLGNACPVERGQRPIGDMTRKRFRDAFSAQRLILVRGVWHASNEVLRGDPIFGARRPFVPRGANVDRLWMVLGVREPEPADCLDVLREIADTPTLAQTDRPIMMETFRALAGAYADVSPQRRTQLKRLPLWTRRGWSTERPVCACEDDRLADAAADQVPLWEPGFASFQGLEDLLDGLGVLRIERDRLTPVDLRADGAIQGEEIRPIFAQAVLHLRDELARRDQTLHDAGVISWRQLIGAPVLIQPDLEVSIELDGLGHLKLATDAHMLAEPPAIVVRDADSLGDPDAGGRAIASLFVGDRQKLAWAWASMWRRAMAGAKPVDIVLSTDSKSEDESADRLIRLQEQASARSRPHDRGGRARKRSGSTVQTTVQPLKDLAVYKPDGGGIVNPGQSRAGVAFPAPRLTAGRTKPTAGGGTAAAAGHSKRTVLPHITEREQLAFDVVQRALHLDGSEIADLRKRRGIGADAMDDLRQLYEIKMSSTGDMPSEVNLTRSEVEAAQNDPDFFLAVVTGLAEDSCELRVRFIFRPLERLTLRVKGEATLAGVGDVEALEYRFTRAPGDE